MQKNYPNSKGLSTNFGFTPSSAIPRKESSKKLSPLEVKHQVVTDRKNKTVLIRAEGRWMKKGTSTASLDTSGKSYLNAQNGASKSWNKLIMSTGVHSLKVGYCGKIRNFQVNHDRLHSASIFLQLCANICFHVCKPKPTAAASQSVRRTE